MAGGDAVDEIIARCDATLERATTLRNDEVAVFIADVARLPPGLRDRSRLAVTMLMAWTRGGGPVTMDQLPHLKALFGLVEHVPSALVTWPQVSASVEAQLMTLDVLNGTLGDREAAQRRIAELTEVVRDSPGLMVVLQGARAIVESTTPAATMDNAGMARMLSQAKGMLGQFGDDPLAVEYGEFLGLAEDMMAANRAGDRAKQGDLLRLLEEKAGSLPPELGLAESLTWVAREEQIVLGLRSADPAEARKAEEHVLREEPGSTDIGRARRHLLAVVSLLDNGAGTDLGRIEQAVEHSRKALAVDGAAGDRVFALTGLALGLVRRSEVTGSTDGLDEAEEGLLRAIELMGGPHHPQWTVTNDLLSRIRGRQGDVAAAGQYGLDAQRSFVWNALLEHDPAEAKRAIKDAAERAIDTAWRCLTVENVSDAIRALDTGRGLLLYAESELRALPARLTAAGRPDLADRWLREGRDAPGLRQDVMTALLKHDTTIAGLLEPPTHTEIRAALTTAGADALIYLVPGKNLAPGHAVIAPKRGPAAYIALPGLQVGRGSEAEQHLVALTDRAREVTPVGGGGDFGEQIRVLCEWAWKAAIGPLLERYFARTLPDAEPRIVLIPMGDLARVPWQAARRADGKYAVQLAAFSQAVSARLYCETARLPPVRPTSTGLVVGDPDTEGVVSPLRSARIEAHAVRNTFYRGGRYVGRRPDDSVSPSGAGTVSQLHEWLADAAPQAGTTLHLACHGRFVRTADGGTAELLLAPDGPDERGLLDAAAIMRVLQAVPERQIGLVVMAACNTGLSIHGYDEAYSLGTAFLAGGARTVLSTQWSIPDDETSSLMFLFHYYLREEGMAPWDALRRAQLWMLDPDRRPPACMPANLASSSSDRHDHVVAWAGFVHGGQ